MFNKIFILLFILAIALSCKKEKVVFDAVPIIEFISITPSVASQYTDSVTITIKYSDGDGDLGQNDAAVKNCFIKDNRIGIVYDFRIKQLSPDNSSVPITGTLNLELGGQGITDNSAQQNVSYTVYVVDRAGHKSNEITTSSIVIKQ